MVSLLVTIGTYASVLDAELAQSRLEAAGIRSVVSTVGDELQLRVGIAEAADARALLEPPAAPHDASAPQAPDAEEREDVERCLICRSSLVSQTQPSLPIRLALGLVLEALPLPTRWLWRPKLKCEVCGHEWAPGRSTAPLDP